MAPQARMTAHNPMAITALVAKQGTSVAGKLKQRDLIEQDFTQDAWDVQLLRGFIATNLPFNSLTNLHLRATWSMLKPSISIPAPSTMRRRLETYYGNTIGQIKVLLPQTARVSRFPACAYHCRALSGTQISLAVDEWSSPNHLAFIAVMGYFITDDWEYKEMLLGFEHLPETHTAVDEAKVVFNCIERYGIAGRLGAITSDNALVNAALNRELKKLIQEANPDWDPVENKVGCLAHTIQLMLGRFISELDMGATNDYMPKALKVDAISKVASMPAGFKKAMEKVCAATNPATNPVSIVLISGFPTGPTAGYCSLCQRDPKW
jgi:hypothetical protein